MKTFVASCVLISALNCFASVTCDPTVDVQFSDWASESKPQIYQYERKYSEMQKLTKNLSGTTLQFELSKRTPKSCTYRESLTGLELSLKQVLNKVSFQFSKIYVSTQSRDSENFVSLRSYVTEGATPSTFKQTYRDVKFFFSHSFYDTCGFLDCTSEGTSIHDLGTMGAVKIK